jgi:hypothetical protein
MTLEKAAWITAVGASWIAAAACFIDGYQGYGWVAVAVGIAASVNLFGHTDEG